MFPKQGLKKRFVAIPLLTKVGVFDLSSLKHKDIDVEQKHNLKSGKKR